MTRKIAALLWVPAPLVLLSALIHTTDADVGGVAGLAAPAVARSVLAYAGLATLLAFGCLAARVRWGAVGFLFAAALIAGGLAYLLALGGSTATTALGVALSFLGLFVIVLTFLAVSVLPVAALGWRPHYLGRS
jgi:hypothetical protein